MMKNYLIIAWRNIKKNTVFSAINVFGLAVGFACCLLIFLFIQHETSYDKFNEKYKDIYRVTSISKGTIGSSNLAVAPSAWAPRMKKEFPEIQEYVRLLKSERTTISTPSKEHYDESDILFADSTFFHVFTFSLLKGDIDHSLERPNTIVLTKETAAKYFGSVDPLGKILEVSTPFAPNLSLEVTGIINKVPSNSHFKYNALISLQTLGDISNLWSYHMFNTYLLLNNGASANKLEVKFKGFVDKYITNNPNADGPHVISLQPLADIHLRSQMVGEIGVNSSITYIYLLAGIALLILTIACFNFMNLSTVRSFKRAKETGLRKVVGAVRWQLIKLFLLESVLFAFFAFILSMVITVLVMPVFNSLSERTLRLDITHNIGFMIMFIIIALAVGVLAGLYPAFVLSSFKSVDVLKGKFISNTKGNLFRKALVTFQFVISIALIAGTVLIYNQLQFIRNKDLGFDKENVFIVSIPPNTNGEKLETFKASLVQQNGIVATAAASTVPGTQVPVNLTHKEGNDIGKQESMQMLFVDHDFVQTMQMHVLAGRAFSKSYSSDKTEGFILNREAVTKAGWKTPADAIGKVFQWVMPDTILKSGKVTGVVEDFNITPLKSPVQPLVMHILPRRFQYLYVRYKGVNATDAIHIVEHQFKDFYPDQPYQYRFLDETINSLYKAEEKLGKIFGYFSGLAILVASLGILGLSLYSSQQRTKEIGVRKVLGASVSSIVRELTKEFLRPVLIAAVIASPVTWWAMQKWLENFAYRVSIHVWMFLVAGILAVLIALITVSFQAIKAAMANPVKSLRTE